MKTPEIKSWDCTEHDPIDQWKPEDPERVGFWCNLTIGIQGQEGGDNFMVQVATHKVVPQLQDKTNLVVIPYYESWEATLTVLQEILAQCADFDWSGISEKLAKHFHWEYQGYSG